MINETHIFPRLRGNTLLKKIYLISENICEPLYLVGGSIRDLLLKGHFSDLDFAVPYKVEELARAVASSLGGTAFPLGSEKKACWRLALTQGEEFLEMDFTPFKGVSIEDDLAKRDFTINAIALSLTDLFESSSPQLIDLYHGVDDLKKGVLKPLSEEAIKDDPLRITRGFRLQALFDLKMEETFLIYAERHGALLKKVAAERIRTELFKTFSSDRSASTLQLMFKTGVLGIILPEIIEWEKLDQGSFHKFNLLKHSLKTVEHLENILYDDSLFSSSRREMIKLHLDKVVIQGINRRELLKFAALLHDSGKPATFKREEGKVSFYGHDEEGAIINKIIAKRLKMGTYAGKILANITKRHMRSLHLSKVEIPTNRAIDRMVRDCGDELIEVLLLALADTMATRDAREVEFTDVEGLVRQVLDRYDELGSLPLKPLLNGTEVMSVAGITEGARVGQYMKIIEEARIDGKIETKKEAINFLQNLKKPESF